MQIEGSNVLVTGGSRGIGEALAREFAAQGARVCVVARSADALDRVASDIGGFALVADLLDSGQVDSLRDHVEAEFGSVDILVNNAGLDATDAFLASDPDALRNVVRLNLETPVALTRSFLPGMVERGKGHLVFTSSLAGTAGFPSLATYCATKAGLNNFAATLRLELNSTDIHTTLIAPGPVDTDMWDELEATPYTADLLKRFRLLQTLPKTTPKKLAKRSVAAIAADRRHVRHPRRLSLNFWLSEAPRRINEAVLTGIKFDVPR
ncbi:MAG: SDR family oxidoreductase [Actinomycetia bacterium]|nr:SDR family oxidoreductase [Actinomycetes bacterium]MCP4086694.1 SDR family oxidoreductase [Actinomycetes bacterium]